jgi:hypothetical protein
VHYLKEVMFYSGEGKIGKFGCNFPNY